MTSAIRISAEWETLESGSEEERSAFAAIDIEVGELSLTIGMDPFARRIRRAPYLSAYHLAEWLAWNWWRLRWEPRTRADDWVFSHRLSTIGSGYAWPDITIFSDGERIAVISAPSSERDEGGYQYICDGGGVVRAKDFENEVDKFVLQVLGQLRSDSIHDSNLSSIWMDLQTERAEPWLRRYRTIEAMQGFDPDEGPETLIKTLLSEQDYLGESAISELSVENNGQAIKLTSADILRSLDEIGRPANRSDAIQLDNFFPSARGDVPAWIMGSRAAENIRGQLRNGSGKLSDAKLCELVAVDRSIISDKASAPIAASLRDHEVEKIALRSKWATGRRFELARLLGDQLVNAKLDRLHLATRSHTYRQKLQRAFAAELLSPFDAVEEMLDGDYSNEQQQEVASYFNVSPMSIRTMLVNHRKIERETLVEFAA